MTIAAFLQRSPSFVTATRLKQMRIGACATIGGVTVHREGEQRFHIKHAGEALLGSAETVMEWIEELRLPRDRASFQCVIGPLRASSARK